MFAKKPKTSFKVRPLNKIALALLFIVVLPALFYSAHEITTLDDNEEMLREIYRQQLETILFSVNQYSWDVTNSWVNTIKLLYGPSTSPMPERFRDFLDNNRGIHAIFFFDTLASDIRIIGLPETVPEVSALQNDLQTTLYPEENLLKRLRRYQQAGYGKLEPVVFSQQADTANQSVALLFVIEEPFRTPEFRFAGIILNSDNFISNVLSPKLEEAAGGQFYIAIFRGEKQYAVVPDTVRTVIEKVEQRKELWLFPEFYVGISPRGQTIEEMARSRSSWDLTFILLLNAILITGVWFVYRNIRREMELAQLKSDFVSNISHELRTPLSLIRMFTETLELDRVPTEEKKQEYYKIIGQETERLTHLVNNMLNFSRIEAGRKEYHFYDVDLNEVARKVLENYQFHLKNEGFKLETNFYPGLSLIKADKESVSESIINLLDNGIKYSDTEKFIRVETGVDRRMAYLQVEDRGIGIAPENQQKIFEKFFRVSDALIHNTKGSGLGLSLVRHIMEAHGGRVIVHSQAGKGSRFRLVFPLNGPVESKNGQ
jgi:two-component system phosphate regulon sensor histidine kinase PhoR